ncbi:hypothetical protein FGG08_007288 [Glutinoglossum americanum]|uniref:Uncharacterized protein n=1 Tax=Glutinoglossum americanum TaxID=1670608 RepID=A0A9P8HUK6_9PEZI|nr:hypothetical protein FGG08_007288 [Glutinoglossum americanum]
MSGNQAQKKIAPSVSPKEQGKWRPWSSTLSAYQQSRVPLNVGSRQSRSHQRVLLRKLYPPKSHRHPTSYKSYSRGSPKTGSGAPAPNAPVTIFSMTSLRTRSWIPRDKEGNILPCLYHASSHFEATFRDFEKLAETASALFIMPHVQVTSTAWSLTDETKEKLGSESRKEAMLDAIQKAQDFAEVLGREIVAVEARDQASSMMGRTKQTSRRATNIAVARTHVDGLALEPEDVEVNQSVSAIFTSVE